MLRILLCAATAGLVACAPTLRERSLSPDDPSNPAAPEALARAPSKTLELKASQAPPAALRPAEQHHHPASSEGEQPGGDIAPVKTMAPGDREHAGHGAMHQSTDEAPVAKATFVCPMHPEVTSDHEGHCPKCGMKLVPKSERGQP